MERNTLLAIVLSAVVLFTYQALFVPKHKSSPESPISNSQISTPSLTADIDQKSTKIVENPVSYVFKTTSSVFSFSNMGGSLHNIVLKNDKSFPVTDVVSINELDNVPYSGQIDNNKVSMHYVDKTWDITKSYIFDNDNNYFKVRMEIKNVSKISILNNLTFKAFKIDETSLENNSNSSRENALYEYSVYANNKIFRKGNASKFSDKNDKEGSGDIHWIGFRDHYHALVVAPEFETKAYDIKAEGEKKLSLYLRPQDKNLSPGESAIYEFSVYVGPQNPALMKKYNKQFEKIVAFSSFLPIEWIAQALYHIIIFFHMVLKSWGVAIILVSLMIYGITYPLTMKSMMSMRKMQEVQPKITALRERFKNDPQKLNTEMMEIYRREKINPFGGCLPFLIQMPFFMALYQILWRAQYFQGQGFLWIKDLSQPDRLLILPFYLPFFGNELNILPIMTGAIMFLQQKISSKNMVVTDEQQVMQQKMMMYIFPVMMIFMFYKFASSWAIYFLIFYILSTLTQWKIAKMSAKK